MYSALLLLLGFACVALLYNSFFIQQGATCYGFYKPVLFLKP